MTADGKFAYTCTRTAFFVPPNQMQTHADTAKIGVYKVNDDGTATNIQWVDTGGYNTRDCQLSATQAMLLTYATPHISTLRHASRQHVAPCAAPRAAPRCSLTAH